MDSVAGQRDKAREAVASSQLVKEIIARGYAVEIRFDPSVGDDIVVTHGARPIGRAPLHDVANGAAASEILAAL